MPPKCGTTNWQNALANLHGKSGRAVIPSLTAYHYANSEEFEDVKRNTKIFGERVKLFQEIQWRTLFAPKKCRKPCKKGFMQKTDL